MFFVRFTTDGLKERRRCECRSSSCRPSYQTRAAPPAFTACVWRTSVLTAAVSRPVICIRLSSPPPPRPSTATDTLQLPSVRCSPDTYCWRVAPAGEWGGLGGVFTRIFVLFPSGGETKKKVDVLFIRCQAQNTDGICVWSSTEVQRDLSSVQFTSLKSRLLFSARGWSALNAVCFLF